MSHWRGGYEYDNLPVGNPQRNRVQYQQEQRYGDDQRQQMVDEEARHFGPGKYEGKYDLHSVHGERRPRQRIEVGIGKSSEFEADFEQSLFRQPNRSQTLQSRGQEYSPTSPRHIVETGMYDERHPTPRQRIDVGRGKSREFEADYDHSLFSHPSRDQYLGHGQEYRPTSRTQDRNECQQPFMFSEYKKKDQRAEQERVRLELEQQEREVKERKRRQREERLRYEIQMEQEMMSYNPFGREGCGAPRRDARGNPLADLRRMRSENEGYMPRDNSPRKSPTEVKKIMMENQKELDEYNKEEKRRRRRQREKEKMEDLKEDKKIELERQQMKAEYDEEIRKKREKTMAKMAGEERFRKEAEEAMKDAKKRKRLQREKERIEEEKDNLRMERERKQMKAEYEEERKRMKEKTMAKIAMEENLRKEAEKAMKDAKKRKQLQWEKERIEEEKDNLRVECERKRMKAQYEEERKRLTEKIQATRIIKDNDREEAKRAMEDARERKRLQREKERMEEERDNLRVEREQKQMREEFEELQRKREKGPFGSTSPPVPAVLRKIANVELGLRTGDGGEADNKEVSGRWW